MANESRFLHFKVDPRVEIPACIDIRTGYDKKADQAYDFRSGKIDRKAYERLGDLSQEGEDAYKRCFTERAPRQPSLPKQPGRRCFLPRSISAEQIDLDIRRDQAPRQQGRQITHDLQRDIEHITGLF